MGVNFGTAYVATKSWPGRVDGLLAYDARDRGVSLRGLGVYASWSGTTPGRDGNVAVVGVPLWLPAAVVSSLAWLRFRSSRRAREWASSSRCPACGYDLRATPDRCPECGAMPVASIETMS